MKHIGLVGCGTIGSRIARMAGKRPPSRLGKRAASKLVVMKTGTLIFMTTVLGMSISEI